MEIREIRVEPGDYYQKDRNAQFFVYTGSMDPPFVTLQEITGDGESIVQDLYARPVVYDDHRGICIILRFQNAEQASGRTIKVSLLQKGIQAHQTVSPYKD